MNPLFVNALDSGKVVVRRWWYNTNSSKDQVTVQFIQQVERPGDTSSLVAIAQGSTNKQTVTALFSFNADVAQAHLGSTEGSFVEEGQPIFASSIWGQEVNIQVTENFTPNPYSKSHEPKINPGTGEVVTAYNGETGQDDPVYRHTELVAGPASHKFMAPREDVNAMNATLGSVPTGLNLDFVTRK